MCVLNFNCFFVNKRMFYCFFSLNYIKKNLPKEEKQYIILLFYFNKIIFLLIFLLSVRKLTKYIPEDTSLLSEFIPFHEKL